MILIIYNIYVLEVPGNYSNLTTYNTTDEYSSITAQRSQTTIIVTTIKPETTVETTEIGTSERKQQQSNRKHRCCLHVSVRVKLSHISCPASLWKKTLNV